MNRFLAASVIGLLLLSILAAGVYFYQRYSIILLDPMRAVPADAAVIVEIKNPAGSLGEFFSGPFRKSLGEDPWIRETEKNFTVFDSILQDVGNVAEIWEDQSLVVSTHLVKAGKFDFLYLTNLPRGWTEQKLKHFIEEAWSLPDPFQRREYENVNIYEAHLNDSTVFTFASSKSVAIFSVSPLLVEQAVRQLKDGSSVTLTKSFLKVVPPVSGDSFVHIYFNNQSLKDIATSISPDYSNGFFRMAASFARWNGYTVQTEEGFYFMNGTAVAFDTSSYLSFLRNQKPQPLTASVIAPSRTALLFEVAFSNFSEYYSHLRFNDGFSLPADDKKKILNDLDEKFHVSFESGFTSWIGNEMALIITEPAGNSVDNNVLACIKARNSGEAVARLNGIRDSVAKQSGMKPSEEKYRNHVISTIPVSGIIPLLYGKIFSGLMGCSYALVNGTLVFSNRPASLKSLIDENEEGKTLAKDAVYQSASARLSEAEQDVNARLYVSPQRSANLYRPAKLNSFLSTLYSSTGIYAQWTYHAQQLGSQILFDFHKKTMKDPVLFWATQLDTILASVPVIIREKNGHTFVYVQDAKNSLYKLDESGGIIWKKNFDAKILSPIYTLDTYRDGRQQLLFNTSAQLILLDVDGNPAGHYPIRLPAKATNGCAVISTPAGYHIYVACSNHYIYAYEAGGKPVPDWNYVRTEQTVSKPIQSFAVRQNTFLVISQDSGMVLVTDKKGNQRILFSDKFRQASHGKSFRSQPDSAGTAEWITSDTAGKIIFFSPDGNVNHLETGGFSPYHEFIFMEGTLTREPGFVVFDNSTLYLLDESGEITGSLAYKEFTSMHSPVLLPDGSPGFLISSPSGDRFAVLNAKGEMEKGFPLKGSVNPVMTEMQRTVILCGNRDGIIYCYKTE